MNGYSFPACFCPSPAMTTLFIYDSRPEGETSFDIPEKQYHRTVKRCSSCGHCVSHLGEDIRRLFERLYSGKYNESTYTNPDGMRRTYERIMALPPEQSDNHARVVSFNAFLGEWFSEQAPAATTVLDVGSGLGVFPARLKQSGYDCTALDPDPQSVRHIESIGIPALTGNFLELSQDTTFDVITFNKVLEHVTDPVAMLCKARLLLKPGGCIYAELPDAAAAVDGPGREEFFIDHYHVFSADSTRYMAGMADLQTVHIETLREPSTKYTIRAWLAAPPPALNQSDSTMNNNTTTTPQVPIAPKSSKIATSFVHGYEDLDLYIPGEKLPSLWVFDNGEQKHFSYPFPRNPEDFRNQADLFKGPAPLPSAQDFKVLPRFGMTGLAHNGDTLYAGSWNGVYAIDDGTFALKHIISHQMMSDLHGIYADDTGLLTILTAKDTVVHTDYDGNILSHFSVGRDLSVTCNPSIEKHDWRFIGKQQRGSCGWWHFNYVQRVGKEIWLTSRSSNAIVAVDPDIMHAELRLMNLFTPSLLHDGVHTNESIYFTSVDGKVIIAQESSGTDRTNHEVTNNLGLYNKDLVNTLIRIDESNLGRMPNWCRGLDVDGDIIYVTIDGRYDTDLSFGLLGITHEGAIVSLARLRWDEIGDVTKLRYVTGFDVKIL